MSAIFRNRFAYLSLSLILLVAAFPLISIGTTYGPAVVWWMGLAALGCGGLIPPMQRLILGPPPAPASKPGATAKPKETGEAS
jgi:hypothetical protein